VVLPTEFHLPSDRLARKIVIGITDKLYIKNSNKNMNWKIIIAVGCQFSFFTKLYVIQTKRTELLRTFSSGQVVALEFTA
jgi:hypothetical protein